MIVRVMATQLRVLLVLLVICAGSAAADETLVTFRLNAKVMIGHQPRLEVTAVVAVDAVRIDLVRDDGKKFALNMGRLDAGQVTTMPIGDGTPDRTYKGTIKAKTSTGSWSDPMTFDTAVLSPIKLQYDAEHLSLDKHELQFKPSRGVDSATLVVFGEDGKELGKGSATYSGKPDGWLAITWTQTTADRVAKLKLRVEAGDGVATNLELTPWSVAIAHEDVNFKTDSAAIDASETAKLDASLVKITETVKRVTSIKMQLYVAGHTDTVGPNDKNLKLSRARANAIAKYFRSKGLAIPIVVAGFGEEVLKVATPQDTDERANRRADYVLGPVGGAPPFGGPYLKVRVPWSPVQ
jgi:outer membrane protein OmpA-like peptidoglycan-associated protein